MNWYLIFAVAVLVVIILMLTLRLLIIKNEIRKISEELDNTRVSGYNKQLQISLIDKNLSAMGASINKNLDYQKELKLKHEKDEKQLKQSISDIAHDLRTPLTIVKGNLQLLSKEQALSAQSQEYIRVCNEKSELLKNMIDDFFELSVLESDQKEIPLVPINATNLIMQFILDNETIIRQKGLTPSVNLPEKTALLLGDDILINRMLSNLLNNILKYGKDNFELGLVEEGERTVIFFSNEIDKDTKIDSTKLFDRSYRADKSRHESGAGLGLYIVKLLAEKQKGQVSAEIKEQKLIIKLYFKGCK